MLRSWSQWLYTWRRRVVSWWWGLTCNLLLDHSWSWGNWDLGLKMRILILRVCDSSVISIAGWTSLRHVWGAIVACCTRHRVGYILIPCISLRRSCPVLLMMPRSSIVKPHSTCCLLSIRIWMMMHSIVALRVTRMNRLWWWLMSHGYRGLMWLQCLLLFEFLKGVHYVNIFALKN